MEKENKFKPCDKCLNCEHYRHGAYEYHSDSEGYVDERCNRDEVPSECKRYEPTVFQCTIEHQIFKEMLLTIHRENKSNGGVIGEQVLKRLDELIVKYGLK